jgi:excinuclease ABC subunit C
VLNKKYVYSVLSYFPENIQTIIKALPESPGVYQYIDAELKLLYIGKAKNLKKRVSSYFNKEHDSNRLRVMVSKIRDIKYIVVNTELDALLLENNLIKKHQPRYNIDLRDDKTYPWICIKNEPFPTMFATRHKVYDGSDYFGPYASVQVMRAMMDMIRQLYPIRTCRLHLSQENINKGKFSKCLEYDIGRCKAPCIKLQTEAEYIENITEVKNIIKGNGNEVLKFLNKKMYKASADLKFEEAAQFKKKIDILERFQSKSTIVNPAISNVEVYSIAEDSKLAYVNFLRIHNGAIIQAHTIELKKKLDETLSELLSFAINELRTQFDSHSKEVIVPFIPEEYWENIEFTVPQRGDKKQLLELSIRNLNGYIFDRQKQLELVDPERHTNRIMQTMMKDLRMIVEPRLIECFDNSNIQGTNAVSAMTVFRDGRASKKDYRHFNVKTVVGPDDFATMEEVIYRRYSRVINDGLELAQLIVIDGGKGQLSAAINSLEKLGLMGKVTIIGIAKKLEEIYFPGDSLPLYLDKRSETLKIIQQIRDEAHRFGITHHRAKRSKNTIKSELNDIKGIGDKIASDLIKAFKSVQQIKSKSLAELAEVVGAAKAEMVYKYFNP